MFGVGMTLKLSDFKVVFTKPKAVIVGICSQFIVMPLLAFLLVTIFQLPTELAVGVILVGCCPGGTSSNVMTYLSKGDVALSVGMTACTTIMAPVVTPALVLLLAGQSIDVSYVSMLYVDRSSRARSYRAWLHHQRHRPEGFEVFGKVLPLISVVAISLIIMAVVSANAAKLMTSGLLIIAVVMLHNVLGYAFGYGVGRVLGLSKAQMRTLSIEVGMQNSGLATSLALTHFATMPLAAVPGTVFSVWHNISGAVYANILARTAEKKGSCSGRCQRQGCRKRVGFERVSCESVARSNFIQRGSLTKSRLERVGFFAVAVHLFEMHLERAGHSGLF